MDFVLSRWISDCLVTHRNPSYLQLKAVETGLTDALPLSSSLDTFRNSFLFTLIVYVCGSRSIKIKALLIQHRLTFNDLVMRVKTGL